MNECVTTAQWQQYVGDFDANRKNGDDSGQQVHDIMHDKPSHISLKQVEVVKSPKSRKSERRKKNREAIKDEKQARKELKQNDSKKPDKDIHAVPDSFKAFTVRELHLVFDKAIRKPSDSNTKGYDGLMEVKEIDLAAEGEDPKPVFIATDLSHLEEQ